MSKTIARITVTTDRLEKESPVNSPVGCRNFKYLAAQMTTHGYLKDQTVMRRRVLCDPYLTHVFSG